MNPLQSKSTRFGLALWFHSRNPLRHILEEVTVDVPAALITVNPTKLFRRVKAE